MKNVGIMSDNRILGKLTVHKKEMKDIVEIVLYVDINNIEENIAFLIKQLLDDARGLL